MKIYIYIVLILSFTSLHSQTLPLDTVNIDERISVIQQMLEDSQKSVQTWNNAWLYGYSIATVGQGAVCVSSGKLTTRQDMALGAATTLLGATFQALNPLNTKKMVAALAQMPDSTQDEKILKLSIAEDYLKTIADKEKQGRSWKVHGLNTAVNLGSGLITWLGFKRSFKDGVVNFLINTVITETQIWTQPMRNSNDYRFYDRKYKKNNLSTSKSKNSTDVLLRTYPSGVAFIIRF